MRDSAFKRHVMRTKPKFEIFIVVEFLAICVLFIYLFGNEFMHFRISLIINGMHHQRLGKPWSSGTYGGNCAHRFF